MSATKPALARLCDLVDDGQTADFFALLIDKVRGSTRAGKPYYNCRFRDAQRTVAFKVWGDGSHFAACEKEWQVGQFFKIRGKYREDERYGPHIEVDKIRLVNDSDREAGFDESQLRECSQHDIPAMLGELRTVAVKHIEDEPLRKLVLALLDRHGATLQRLPAVRDRAYPFVGGLLEHTLSVTHVAIDLAERYARAYPELKPPLNQDLVTAGAILHDIGRVQELGDEVPAPAYTVTGRLLGHQVLGRDLVREAARDITGLKPELLALLEHILLSHLTPAESTGSRLPLIPEALIVLHADALDIQMEMFARCLQRDHAPGPFTDRDQALGRQLLKARI